ncbi:MAG: helix-turn-helix domain-containing protein [Actinomycetota bacterium]
MSELLPTPLASAVARVGDRWTMLIVAALLDGPRRFNDLIEALPGLAPNILSQRLKHLEREFLVVAEPYSQRPPRFGYRLSERGMDLAGALRLLADWGARHAGVDPVCHEVCGTPVESRWYCPTCGEIIDEPEAEPEVRFI